MARRDSMSNRALRALCTYWLRPEVPLFDGVDTAARADGDDLHDLAAANINGVDDDGICSVRAIEMWQGLKPLLDKLRARPNAEVLAEVSFGYRPSTFESRVIGVGLSREERDALAYPDEYTGTADVVMLFRDAQGKVVSLEVADHKTTWLGGEPQDATEQLVTYATIAADAYGVTEVLAYPIIVTPISARLGDGIFLDALAIESEITTLTEELLSDVSQARPNPGPHCSKRYCKARANCPATREAIAMVVDQRLELDERPPSTYVPGAGIRDLRPDDMSKLYVVRKLLEEAIAAIKSDERAWLEEHKEIVLADGSRITWEWSAPEKPKLDTPRALAIVEEAGAQSAVKASMTWADLERAVGKAKANDVREALRAAGATAKGGFFKPVHRAAPKLPGTRLGSSLVESFDKKVKETLRAAGVDPDEGAQ